MFPGSFLMNLGKFYALNLKVVLATNSYLFTYYFLGPISFQSDVGDFYISNY